MGGNGSSNRKVSFELDEQDRVRVLQGIRLSEDVVNRMKEPGHPRRDQRSPPPPSLSHAAEEKSKSCTEIQPPTANTLGRKPSEAEEDLYRRYEQEQAIVQEELLRLAKREREAASESLNANLQRERSNTNEEKQKAAQLSQELQWKEVELKRKDTFYKEQLAQIEKKNNEIYKMTLEQYNEAITSAEDQIRKRNTKPICGNLQADILKCYNENKGQVLNCSELVKDYQRCVRLAQQELLVHFD
ncbi:MICOS complex subunit MIC25 [Tiliqua scincoides]|uniref:MICOS complex subunit MIC25 n=1 Tax=Tiliqua scincoides TaxID=71010 RepID=UPI0034633123